MFAKIKNFFRKSATPTTTPTYQLPANHTPTGWGSDYTYKAPSTYGFTPGNRDNHVPQLHPMNIGTRINHMGKAEFSGGFGSF